MTVGKCSVELKAVTKDRPALRAIWGLLCGLFFLTALTAAIAFDQYQYDEYHRSQEVIHD